MRIRLALALPLLFPFLVGCGSTERSQTLVVTSIPPLAMIARELVPEAVEVESLVPAGSSPHAFDLSPNGARLLERASLVLRIGPGFDDFAASGGPAWAFLGDVGKPARDNGHFWTDPQTVLRALPSLSRALQEALPSQAGEIGRRAKRLEDSIRGRIPQWRARLQPVRGRSLVLFHDSLLPFCDRFGIRVAGMVEPKPGVEPSIAELVQLAKEARRDRPKVVVSEPQLPARPAEVLAREIGVPVLVLDPYGGAAGTKGYIAFMDDLTSRLEEALR